MDDTKIQTNRGIYEAFGRGDVDAILDQVTDDVDWAVEPEGSAPWNGVRRGKGEVANFFKAIGDRSRPQLFPEMGKSLPRLAGTRARYAFGTRRRERKSMFSGGSVKSS